jgi:hypothetical protein
LLGSSIIAIGIVLSPKTLPCESVAGPGVHKLVVWIIDDVAKGADVFLCIFILKKQTPAAIITEILWVERNPSRYLEHRNRCYCYCCWAFTYSTLLNPLIERKCQSKRVQNVVKNCDVKFVFIGYGRTQCCYQLLKPLSVDLYQTRVVLFSFIQ